MKVVLCSSILYTYYWFILRNKQFHQYNRFYLMGISVLSWLIPFIKIDIINTSQNKCLDNKLFVCLQREKIIINKKTIVFKFLFSGKKKFNTNARKDRKIIPFKEVLQKK